MKAIVLNQHGGPDLLQLSEINAPAPTQNQVLISHAALGVNFVDTQHRAGRPYPIGLPFIPGVEAAGTVVATGAQVTEFTVGDRVAYAGHMGSVYAEYSLVPEDRLVPVPDNVDLTLAAATLMQGMTAHMLTHSVYPIQAGDYVFIQAAAGGVGLQLVQMAKWRGAIVLGTASSSAKAALAQQAGADHIFLPHEADIIGATRRLTDGQGVHVVYDSVGRATFDQSLALLRPVGTLAVFGLSSGAIPPFDINRLSGITGAANNGSLFLTCPTLNHYIAHRADLLLRAGAVLGALGSGQLQAYIADVLPLAAAAQAHRMIERRQIAGKLLLRP